jgi:hypothetical protein
MTLRQFDAMLAGQGGCAICHRTEPTGNGQWAVDHDHGCCPGEESCGKCVRGILCSMCNHGLGMFEDNLDTLMSAVAYLKR